MKKSLLNDIKQKAEQLPGILDAVLIDSSTIVASEWVRWKCRFGCTGYSNCLTCPPYAPTPSETNEYLKCYSKAILLHSHEYRKLRAAVLKTEKDAFLSGLRKALGLSAGPCNLCASCALDEGCRHPDKSRPSLEACGIDVYTTVRSNGLKIEVLTSTDQTPDYYAIVLLD